jgi:gliding motility-associated-like protein
LHKWFYVDNDPKENECNYIREHIMGLFFSAILSYDLSLEKGTYQDLKLINTNAFLYYEECFDRRSIKSLSLEKFRNNALSIQTEGGAFYDLQLMPDGAIYLANSDKFGGLSKLHTTRDSMWVEWVKDGSPQGFQGDAFSKVVSSYKLPGIKILYSLDSIICKEKGVPLTAKVLGADSVQWNTGSHSFSILAQEEGWYAVSANTWFGVVKDSVYIRYARAMPKIKDTIKCSESEVKLSPKGNFLSYQLYTIHGQTRENIKDSGIYYMKYTFDGCIKYDTFKVSHHQWPEMVISQIDTGCIITEEIPFMIAPDSFEYRWNGTLVSPPFYTREFENILEVVSNEGCKKTFIIRPESVCNTSYFIPNAFTPNKDGLNDVWRPVGEGIYEYRYQVFNRWGEKLVESDVNEPFTGNDYPVGVYVFLIELKLKDGTTVYKQATVFLGR